MPTPLELLLDPVSLGVFAMCAVLVLWESLAPARRLPEVSGWKARALAAFVFYFFLSSYLPLVWDRHLAEHQLFDLSHLNPLVGALVGIVVYELLLYAWHRTIHTSNWLWRSFHQMHHSAERLDAYGAFFFSPLDMVGFTFLSSLSLSLVVGLGPEAITLFLFATLFLSVFQHMNVHTPQWLGYLVQRPESHTVHHGRGLHRYNYADLPVVDMLFGTFRNPRRYEMETGFYHGASARILDMLAFRDISKATVRSTRSVPYNSSE